MIRMVQSKSAAHAKAYFSDALLKSDYYASDQEMAGYWQGKLAARLGLHGPTTKEAFFDLCENRDPVTHMPLTPITRDGRTTGYDINFHCPKSVSVLHSFCDDGHILTAFQDSVTEIMSDIEADCKTRVRQGGVYNDRATEEMVWAHFVHQTARPVDGALPDPHLHSHCFVFNATWDETENRVKAAQFRDIQRDMPYYQARFHKVFADRLIAQGYQIRQTEKSFEVVGVPKSVIGLFSKRSDEIGRIAQEKGITDAKELGELGARTRAKKQKGLSMEELRKEWRAQIASLPAEAGEGQTPVRFAPAKEGQNFSSRQCVEQSLLHSFERASVMDGRRILATAYRFGLGQAKSSAEEIDLFFYGNNNIIHVTEKDRTLCTTKEVLAEEKRMVELARKGQGKLSPLYPQVPDLKLEGQQAAAVKHILTTTHRVSIVKGGAGTGKTTLMREAVRKMEEAGKTVTTVAPSAQASRGVLKQEGFEDADTVARLLIDKSMQEKLKGQVLWVDEAGLLGTKDMTALLEIAEQQNARVVLGGDTRQHASVVRGDALRILNTVGGIRFAEVSKIYRQKNEDYRAAIEDLSKGRVGEGFEKLDAAGYIKSVDPMEPHYALVKDYIKAIDEGKTALVVCPTHAQGEKVTEGIREGLKEHGILGKKEITALKLKNLNFTEAEKSDARNFREGQYVQFNQNAPGFKRGSLWVVETAQDQIHLTNTEGRSRPLPLGLGQRYDVFVEQEISLSKGDRIQITRNGFDHHKKRLDNGDTLSVVSVTKGGDILLRNDTSHATYKIDKDFGHLNHAYCITSYAAQGKTVDEVLIYQPAATFPATDAKQFYVSASRGRERLTLYTDDKEALLEHASDMGERQSAIELVDGYSRHREAILHQEIGAEKNVKEKPFIHPKKREDHEPEL